VTWSVVDSFPKNAMGKIIRTRLPGPPRHPGQHRCPGLLPQRDHGRPLPRERSLTWLRRNTRLPRCGAPEDFTGAVLWLASDASQYVAGQTIVIIDGGWTAR
jgi:NAD(P)-dependent dehydrogenase (short-subunit alcohol dehydrogenase family)